jgi:hypothetical protein
MNGRVALSTADNAGNGEKVVRGVVFKTGMSLSVRRVKGSPEVVSGGVECRHQTTREPETQLK